MSEDKTNMKLDTCELKDVEIFEAGTWKGMKFTVEDVDRIIENFRAGVLEPYVNIDHSPEATAEFKEAFKAQSLGFVSDLRRNGKKLVADFKQVPRLLGELIQAGPLKKKSVELWKSFKSASGQLFDNVLEAVTFTGKVPAVNTLSEYVALFKQEGVQGKGEGVGEIMSFSNEDYTQETDMENVTIPKAEYDALVQKAKALDELMSKKAGEAEMKCGPEEVGKMKLTIDEQTKLIATLQAQADELTKLKADTAKAEAERFIETHIQEGRVLPKHKDFLVQQYLTFKADEAQFAVFTDELSSRAKVVDLTVKTPAGQNAEGKVELTNDPEDRKSVAEKIDKLMAEGKTYNEAHVAVVGEAP